MADSEKRESKVFNKRNYKYTLIGCAGFLIFLLISTLVINMYSEHKLNIKLSSSNMVPNFSEQLREAISANDYEKINSIKEEAFKTFYISDSRRVKIAGDVESKIFKTTDMLEESSDVVIQATLDHILTTVLVDKLTEESKLTFSKSLIESIKNTPELKGVDFILWDDIGGRIEIYYDGKQLEITPFGNDKLISELSSFAESTGFKYTMRTGKPMKLSVEDISKEFRKDSSAAPLLLEELVSSGKELCYNQVGDTLGQDSEYSYATFYIGDRERAEVKAIKRAMLDGTSEYEIYKYLLERNPLSADLVGDGEDFANMWYYN